MKTIIAAVDLSHDDQEHTAETFRWSVEEAVVRHADVEVVYAVPPVISPYAPAAPGTGAIDIEAEADALARQAQQRLDRCVKRLRRSVDAIVPIRTVVRSGAPEQVLVEQSLDADLLVVGARHHGALLSAVIGSVSDHVVHNAHCPVVVIPR